MDSSKAHTNECVQCIRKVLSCPDFAPDCSSDRELCEILSDGEILCSILTELSNGRLSCDITASYYSKNSHLLARKNLRFFLDQCRQAFDLEDHELFEPDDLLTLRNPERVVKTVLRLVSGIGDRKEAEATPPSNERSGELKNVVKEICDHERALIEKLTKLLMYRSELQGLLSEWSDDLLQVVFKHIDQLYALHTEFHARLTSLSDQGCEQFCRQLSSLFSEMKPKLEIYFQYYSHMPTANMRMEMEFKRAPDLKNQLKLLERYFRGLSFRGLFDAPIRQTTNYLQLFKRLHDAVLVEIPDAAKSVETTMQDSGLLLDRANEFKRQAEQLAAVREVLAQVSGLPAHLTEPAEIGLHQADDCFKVRAPRDGKVVSEYCYCILTTKQLIVATKASKKDPQATYWFNVPITKSPQVNRKSDRSGSVEISESDGVQATLKAPKSGSRSIGVWPELLDRVRTLNFPAGWNMKGHKFELRTFPAGSKCSKCNKELAGAVMQGYGCGHCDSRLHLDCLRLQSRRESAPALPIRRSASEYYHKKLTRDQAEKLLMKREVGAFILRKSGEGKQVMSIKSGAMACCHVIVEKSAGGFALGSSGVMFPSMELLLDFYRSNMMSVHKLIGMDFTLGDGLVAKQVFSKGIWRQGTLDEASSEI